MPYAVVITRRFQQAYRRLTPPEQDLVDAALRQLQTYLQAGQAPVGLGLKRLHRRTYEVRAGLALRVVYVVEGNTVYVALLGRHDEVQRFLKNQ